MSPLPSFASFMLSGLLLATAPAAFSPAQSAEARIEDFRFECRTPDGKRLKPKLGDVEGAYFTDLPGQRDACLAAVDNKIALCRENTSFISNTRDREYAGCLPIFRSQAQQCVAFFQAERAKCNAGGTGAAAPGGGSGLAGMGNAAAAPDPWGDGSSNGGDSVWDPPASEDAGFVEVRSEWSEDPGFVEVRPGQVVGNAAAAPDPWGDGSSGGGDSVWDPPASEDAGFVEVRSEWSEDPGFVEVRPGQVVGSGDGDADEDAASYATALSEVLGDDAPQREATQDDYTGALAALEAQREAERRIAEEERRVAEEQAEREAASRAERELQRQRAHQREMAELREAQRQREQQARRRISNTIQQGLRTIEQAGEIRRAREEAAAREHARMEARIEAQLEQGRREQAQRRARESGGRCGDGPGNSTC